MRGFSADGISMPSRELRSHASSTPCSESRLQAFRTTKSAFTSRGDCPVGAKKHKQSRRASAIASCVGAVTTGKKILPFNGPVKCANTLCLWVGSRRDDWLLREAAALIVLWQEHSRCRSVPFCDDPEPLAVFCSVGRQEPSSLAQCALIPCQSCRSSSPQSPERCRLRPSLISSAGIRSTAFAVATIAPEGNPAKPDLGTCRPLDSRTNS